MRSISKISAALDKLESRIPDPAATKCVWIIVDNGDGPRTVEGEQARHLAEHPSDVGCNWIIWRIMRPGNSREYLARRRGKFTYKCLRNRNNSSLATSAI